MEKHGRLNLDENEVPSAVSGKAADKVDENGEPVTGLEKTSSAQVCAKEEADKPE